MERRDFLKSTALAGLAAPLTLGAEQQSGNAERTVRVGLVGVGERGTGLTRVLLALNNVEIKAICDIS